MVCLQHVSFNASGCGKMDVSDTQILSIETHVYFLPNFMLRLADLEAWMPEWTPVLCVIKNFGGLDGSSLLHKFFFEAWIPFFCIIKSIWKIKTHLLCLKKNIRRPGRLFFS